MLRYPATRASRDKIEESCGNVGPSTKVSSVLQFLPVVAKIDRSLSEPRRDAFLHAESVPEQIDDGPLLTRERARGQSAIARSNARVGVKELSKL